MKGWKTKAGSVITIFGTLYGMYSGSVDVATGVQVCGGAVMALGLGHKIDKIGQ